MKQYIVTKKLNKRSSIPANLPDANSIVGTVNAGFTFLADEVSTPNASLEKWFVDADGFYYWGGAISQVESIPQELSLEQIKAVTGCKISTAARFLPFIKDTCDTWKINTPTRRLCFLAQVGHESGGLFYTEELASGNAYENRKDLGNIQPGDGVKFKGRGLIQITGRANYTQLAKDLHDDFVNHPELLGGKNANLCTDQQLKNATQSAGWFWDLKHLNSFADKIDLQLPIDEKGNNLLNFKAITSTINGGYNGLADRIAKYKAGVDLFQ